MTDSFLQYQDEFEQCRDEAVRDIKLIASASNSRARKEYIERAENNIDEAERYLRILETESRAGDAQERRKMHQSLRSCKSQLDKVKSLLERNKLIADSQQRLNSRPKDMSTKDQMVNYQKRLDKTGGYLDDAQQLIANSENLAGNITTNLLHQREQLGNVRNNVDTAREDVQEAQGHLQSLKRKHQWKIFSLYFIIMTLSAHIVYRIIRIFA